VRSLVGVALEAGVFSASSTRRAQPGVGQRFRRLAGAAAVTGVFSASSTRRAQPGVAQRFRRDGRAGTASSSPPSTGLGRE